jgi:hypothetical protein
MDSPPKDEAVVSQQLDKELDGSLDQAYVFLSKAHVDAEESHAVDMKRLLRKFDWRFVPILLLCYTMNLLDKVAYNVRDTTQRQRKGQ